MRRLWLFITMIGIGAGLGMAQWGSQTEIRGFYLQGSGFDYRSGSPDFDVRGETLKGGGFGFTSTPTEWFGIWLDVNFFSDVRQGSVSSSLMVEAQGLRFSTPSYGPFQLYGRAGGGLARFVFDFGGSQGGQYSPALILGGGAMIHTSSWLSIYFDASQLTVGLPDLTGAPDRDGWDTSLLVSIGVALKF